jgi:hypothetical protein
LQALLSGALFDGFSFGLVVCGWGLRLLVAGCWFERKGKPIKKPEPSG